MCHIRLPPNTEEARRTLSGSMNDTSHTINQWKDMARMHLYPDTMHVTGVGVCMYVRVSVHVCHKECADY